MSGANPGISMSNAGFLNSAYDTCYSGWPPAERRPPVRLPACWTCSDSIPPGTGRDILAPRCAKQGLSLAQDRAPDGFRSLLEARRAGRVRFTYELASAARVLA